MKEGKPKREETSSSPLPAKTVTEVVSVVSGSPRILRSDLEFPSVTTEHWQLTGMGVFYYILPIIIFYKNLKNLKVTVRILLIN